MKSNSIQQEIILSMYSKISRRRLKGEMFNDAGQYLSHTERLEQACWNGLLNKILPGTIEKPSHGNKLHLWQIRSGARILNLEFCTFPVNIEKQHSIDPYLFVPTTCAN